MIYRSVHNSSISTRRPCWSGREEEQEGNFLVKRKEGGFVIKIYRIYGRTCIKFVTMPYKRNRARGGYGCGRFSLEGVHCVEWEGGRGLRKVDILLSHYNS